MMSLLQKAPHASATCAVQDGSGVLESIGVGTCMEDFQRPPGGSDSALLDAIYRDRVTADYRHPPRLKVWVVFGAILGIAAALGAAWPQQPEAKPPLKTITLDLTDGPTSEIPSLPPPTPPPPPGGSSSATGQTPIKPEKFQIPVPSPEAQGSMMSAQLPEPSPTGGSVGGVIGGAQEGTVDGMQGGVLGAPPHGGGSGSDTTITPPRADAAYLRNPQPLYPPFSRRAGETGTVKLRVLVGVNGKVVELEVKQSSGFPRLDQAAIEAVRKWTFLPARRGAEALEAWVLVPITFSLNN